jgi:cytochrome c peroxidase
VLRLAESCRLDIGIGHTPLAGLETDSNIAAGLAELDVPDLPVFLISGCPDPFNAGQATSFYTTDPGKALISGQCSDVNRVKGPILRGLAARAPYFHNGAAANLTELVNFYSKRFQMRLTDEQRVQLVAFLNSL